MHGDEENLEAAGEEAEHQQHVAAMTEGLGERLRDRLLARARSPALASAGTPAPATAV